MKRWAESEPRLRTNQKITGGMLRKALVVGATPKDIEEMTTQLNLNPNQSPKDIREMLDNFAPTHNTLTRKGSSRFRQR